MEASNVQPGTPFHMLTQPLTTFPVVPTHLRFWYYMYGRHMGTLNVYAVSQQNEKILVWSEPGGKKSGEKIC